METFLQVEPQNVPDPPVSAGTPAAAEEEEPTAECSSCLERTASAVPSAVRESLPGRPSAQTRRRFWQKQNRLLSWSETRIQKDGEKKKIQETSTDYQDCAVV